MSNALDIELPKPKQMKDASPCRYSASELEQRIDESMKSFREKKYCTSSELRKRHPQKNL
jgi:hypothetical protein